MTLYKLNTDVIEIPDILIESEDLFDLKDLVAHKILVPITEKKCCDKCYKVNIESGRDELPEGKVWCVNCTCHKETLNPYDVKEEPVMTPKTNEQTVEEMASDIWAIIYSGLVKQGVKFPDNFDGIGAAYGGYARLIEALTRATAEAVDGERERTINELRAICEGDDDCIDNLQELIDRLPPLTGERSLK